MRYFNGHPHLSEREAERFASVDHRTREALVAVLDDKLIAVGRYEMLDNELDAEVAFVVVDRWQGLGLGSILLHELAALARAAGVRRFVAETLAENHRMLAVFTRSGLRTTTSITQGIVSVTMELDGN
jgi:GNAT superfamily N-acetyltransferase